eukprot:600552-Prymnesium_polylepis.1
MSSTPLIHTHLTSEPFDPTIGCINDPNHDGPPGSQPICNSGKIGFSATHINVAVGFGNSTPRNCAI